MNSPFLCSALGSEREGRLLRHLDPVLKKHSRVREGRLVAQVLRALLERLWELLFHQRTCGWLVLSGRGRGRAYRTFRCSRGLRRTRTCRVRASRLLRFSSVQVIDRVEVKVFCVPAEHSFPCSGVKVRAVHSGDALLC